MKSLLYIVVFVTKGISVEKYRCENVGWASV